MNINNQLQKSNVTEFNRYPRIFSKVAEVISKIQEHQANLLSFGCSSGEEIISLDKLYVKGANLIGVDISQKMIEEARKKIPENNTVRFFQTEEAGWKIQDGYDVVMALSVLCNWPKTEKLVDIKSIYKFSEFEMQVKELSNFVKPGGYLVIHNTNYNFEDTKEFINFKIAEINLDAKGFVTRFDKQGNIITDTNRKHFNFFQKNN